MAMVSMHNLIKNVYNQADTIVKEDPIWSIIYTIALKIFFFLSAYSTNTFAALTLSIFFDASLIINLCINTMNAITTYVHKLFVNPKQDNIVSSS